MIDLKQKVLAYHWERWLERPFNAFVFSLFKGGNSRNAFKKLGIDAEYTIFFFQKGSWYRSESVTKPFAAEIETAWKNGLTVFSITDLCEQFHKECEIKINKLINEHKPIEEKLSEVVAMAQTATTFIWLAHGFEYFFTERLHKQVPNFISNDIEKFIGDISFPIKKNAHNLMEEALRGNESLETVREKFGWIRARDGFSDAFSIEELQQQRDELQKELNAPEHIFPDIPEPLRLLARETQELVFYRTLRTDLFYKLLYHARPIFQKAAQKYNISFARLKNYSIYDLISGTLREYPEHVNVIGHKEEFQLFEEPIIADEEEEAEIIQGVVAYKGKIQGTVKIVKTVQELDKVKEGDILVTQMTFPSFIMAMKRAAAFVTDEGGITCHAAIVAREMKKPCIIGTKNATRILKDGDKVEVDAEKGIVRKI